VLNARREMPQAKEGISHNVLAAAIMGLLFVAIGFTITLSSSGLAERYLSEPGYLLLLVPSGVVGAYLINSRRKLTVIGTMLMLVIFVYVGTSSPDWAPFENPEFGALRKSYVSHLEAITISGFLPQQIYVYCDNDIGLLPALIKGIQLLGPGSYETERRILRGIKDGVFDPSEFAYMPVTLYIIKTRDVNPQVMRSLQAHIVYSSGRHIILVSARHEM